MSAERPRPARKQAVALAYDPLADAAPRVTASGQGLVAEEIVQRARDAGVPVKADAALASGLAALQVGSAIPPELWRAVAEVLAYVYRLESRLVEGSPGRRGQEERRR
ncbi:MAG TPA: EscU/YscU/HrcU family type III secretion system export apparatus switch protein [Chloroflexota bacterium]|nr:EscU/YscU/HrcU family type III secretion system export apparatus switch protein [Chloroflexota bacterium]